MEMETFPVVLRADFEMALEHPAHLLVAAEAALLADELQRQLGLLDLAAGHVEADLLDKAGRGRADLLQEDTGKIAWAHGQPTGQSLNGKVAGLLEGIEN